MNTKGQRKKTRNATHGSNTEKFMCFHFSMPTRSLQMPSHLAFFQHYLEDPDWQDSKGHAPARQEEDIKTMAQVLVDDGHVFQMIPLRKRHMIGKYHSLFHKHSAVDLRKWLRKTCKNILLST